MTVPPLVTVGIPLYRSAPFVGNVLACIEAMPATGVEILVSDRHLADDALERIAAATASDPRVRCMAATDALDWVAHINLLMSAARGTYWRLLPHDDFVPAGSLALLIEAMEADPGLLVAYAATRAEDLCGTHLPALDVTTARPDLGESWTYDCFLNLYRNGHFGGAFKGVIRMEPIRRHELFIRPNVGLVDSERLWLFGLALVGRFRFVPDSLYVKRYHDTSTHRQWRRGSTQRLGAIRLMLAYLRALHPPNATRRLAQLYIVLTMLPLVDRWPKRWQHPLPWPLDQRIFGRLPLVGRWARRLGERLLALPNTNYTCEADR